MLYAMLFVPGLMLWRTTAPAVKHWVWVTAPTTVDRLFDGATLTPLERVIAEAPLPASARALLLRAAGRAATSLEHATRSTLAEMITAARYAAWLAVAPVLAFLLLAGAPAFQRSALRVLPRGHLQWRAEEYLRDVNSALAGYVRAQAAAAVTVGLACVIGFLAIGLPSAISIGVASGVLELVPAVGPLTAMLIASAQAGPRLVPVLVFLIGLRIVQDYVIYPRLVRHGMHLSTPAVILTVWIGAAVA